MARAPATIGTRNASERPLDAWGLILAGGRGRRLEHVTTALGEPREKQFCRFGSDRSLLQRSFDRLEPLVSGATVVVAGDQARLASEQLAGLPVVVVAQPLDRGTGVAALVGLLDVMERTPEALVLLSPADHAFADERVLRRALIAAGELARREDAAVLLGAEPDAPRSDYGWILPDRSNMPAAEVSLFLEKPPRFTAGRLMVAGGLFNTMIVVAPASALMRLFEIASPQTVEAFARDAPHRAFLEVESLDFCRDVLEESDRLLVERLPRAAGWTDLGDERRLTSWLEQRGADEVRRRMRRGRSGRAQPGPRQAHRRPPHRSRREGRAFADSGSPSGDRGAQR